jgi:hypothetical protein
MSGFSAGDPPSPPAHRNVVQVYYFAHQPLGWFLLHRYFFMKQITKLGPKQFIHTDVYSEYHSRKIGRYFCNFLSTTIVIGIAFVVTGAMLGTDLTKPLLQWSRQQTLVVPR